MKSLPTKIGTIVGCALLSTVLMSATVPYEPGYESGPPGDWENIDNNWYFTYHEATLKVKATGWKYINDKWYYFEPSGVMATGWQHIDGKWYYLQPVSDIEPGYKEVNGLIGKPYYVDRPGVMTTGWQYIDNKWYYFEPSGEMVTGWQEIDHDRYYFNEDGSMKTGWFEMDGKLYNASPRGTANEYNPADVVEKPGTFTVSAAKKKAAEEAARTLIDEWDNYAWIGGKEVPKPTIEDLSTLRVGEAIPILQLVEGKLISAYVDLYPVICDDKIITSIEMSEEDSSGKTGGMYIPPTESIKEAGYLGGAKITPYHLEDHTDILRQGCAFVTSWAHYPGYLINDEGLNALRSHNKTSQNDSEDKSLATTTEDNSAKKNSSDEDEEASAFLHMKEFLADVPDTLLVSEPLEL